MEIMHAFGPLPFILCTSIFEAESDDAVWKCGIVIVLGNTLSFKKFLADPIASETATWASRCNIEEFIFSLAEPSGWHTN